MSPSAASGERRPPAPSTKPTLGARRGRRRVSATRSAIVNGGQTERVGRHRRRHRHRVPAVRRAHVVGGLAASRAASTLGVGRRRARSGAYDCAGLRAATGDAARRAAPSSERGRAPRLADLGPGAGDERPMRHGRRPRPSSSSARAASAVDLLDRCARPRARPAGATVPGGTVGGRIAGTRRPRSSSARRGGERPRASSPHTHRDDRRRVARAERARRARAAGRAARRPRLTAHDLERGERGGGVGRGRRGREDVGAGPVHERGR